MIEFLTISQHKNKIIHTDLFSIRQKSHGVTNQTRVAMSQNTHELDRIDVQILEALQEDGRIPNTKLAEAVSLSPTAVLSRVQRLTRKNYIEGYHARLNPKKLNTGFLVFVAVLLDKTTPHVFEHFKAAVQAHQEVMECHMVAGGFDYFLKTRHKNMNGYRDFVGRVLWEIPGVRETRTFAVMEEIKETGMLSLANALD